MGYLAAQIALFVLPGVVAGVTLGWWLTRFAQRACDDDSNAELQGLRRNYADAIAANAELRERLRQLEHTLGKLRMAPSEAGYGEFLQTRKLLEKVRGEYGRLMMLAKRQERQLDRLRRELCGARTELAALQQAQASPQSADESKDEAVLPSSSPLAVEGGDLERIRGITPSLAGKLKALGILSCQQLAEFSRDDLRRIQCILGEDVKPSLEDCVGKARALFQQPEGMGLQA